MYQFKFVATLLLFSCLGLSAQAKKQKLPPQHYNVDLGNNDKISVQVKKKNDVYALRSRDRKLGKKGYKRATIVFDYSEAPGVMVIAASSGREHTCFYKDAPDTKTNFQEILKGQLNSDVTFGDPIKLDGRAPPKSNSDAKAWRKSMQSVKRMCKNARIVELTALHADADLTSTKTHRVIGLEADFTIVHDSPPSKKEKRNKQKENGDENGNQINVKDGTGNIGSGPDSVSNQLPNAVASVVVYGGQNGNDASGNDGDASPGRPGGKGARGKGHKEKDDKGNTDNGNGNKWKGPRGDGGDKGSRGHKGPGEKGNRS